MPDEATTEPDRIVDLSAIEVDLDLVEQVLERIEAGDHGRCLDCGEALDESMLLADPLARHCGCATGDAQIASGSIVDSGG